MHFKSCLAIIALLLAASNFFGQINKVAIISIWGDKNLSDNPIDTKLYEKIMNDPSFDISNQVNKFEELMMQKLIPAFPFPFMPKNEVVGKEGYEALNELSTYKNTAYMVSPADQYIALAAFGIVQDNDAIKKALELYPDVDGVMIAYMDYTLQDGSGVGPYMTKKIRGDCNIKIFDREGKRIFKLKTYGKPSKTSASSIGGIITDVNKINTMIEEASVSLFEKMEGKMEKKLAKMAKKLSKV